MPLTTTGKSNPPADTKKPKTYGEDQGFKDRRVPFYTPFEAVKNVWNGINAPSRKPVRKRTQDKPRLME